MDPLPAPGDEASLAASPATAAQNIDMSPPPRSPRPRQSSPPRRAPPGPEGPSPSSDYFGDDLDLAMELDAADADEEEAMRAMEEDAAMHAGRQASAKQRAGRAPRVKQEQPGPSSGGRAAPGGAGSTTGLSGQVEVLELDSDDDEPVAKREADGPGLKRRKVQGGTAAVAGPAGGGARGRTTVLELDSDD